VAQISTVLAASLVAGTGKSFEELSRSAEAPRGVTPLALTGARVDLRIAVDRHIVPDRNVVALLEGSDARLKDEWVLVTAHFDHNGAERRKSSTAPTTTDREPSPLLDIRRGLRARGRKTGQRPKRSILFAAWNSEERGLLGAWRTPNNRCGRSHRLPRC
jgi:hypothetical protein